MIKEAIKIFKNDLKTIRNLPLLVVFLLVIVCLPSLYILLTVPSVWDPYSQTSNIEVAVVNNDLGYTTNGTYYNVGNTLVEELRSNKNLSWQFVDKNTALAGVKNGKYYAALIIPSDFSENLLSIETTHPKRAKIQYIDNEKLSPIATRLTSAGADAVQNKINDEIVKTIDGIIFGKLSDTGELAKENKAQFLKLRSSVNELNGKITTIDSSISEANSDMSTVNQIWPKISAALPEIQKYSNYARKNYDSIYHQILSDPQKSLSKVQNMESEVNTTITGLEYVDAILTSLYNATGDQELKPVIAQVEENINKANQVLLVLKDVESAIKDGKNPKGKLAELKSLIDQMDDGVNTLAANKASINQKINNAAATLTLVNSKWPAIRSAIPIAAAKLNSIDEEDIDKLISFSDTDQDDVKNYFESPVELDKESMYPMENYGSALAPFYIALSLWIGCLISVAIVTVRVKSNKYGARAAYFGRLNLFLMIGMFQALLIALSALFLNVQNSSAALLTVTILMIGACFMVILYSLVSIFGSLGKVMAVVLLILQIASSGGVYPAELQSGFFQTIQPFLPMTYAIRTLREVVAGVLWTSYWYNLGILFLFAGATLGLTLLIVGKIKDSQGLEEKLKESGLVE
ncbi:YhgE/Pip domain-containing protein [Methanobacterium congolense]|uniref:Phage infection protein n=1 Tax=Methanobacterium congolense TaxID=118062 RepID=A0A1D3L2E2_9EURY|nr:YhgE/Pip domain-containing protein [Methanobacterium congolense]SCG85679.1 Phage infection protein [Methanobacterium congolense]